MDVSGKSKAELVDLLISLSASLKDEDLENPETYALAGQLLSLLDPSADPLPQDIIDQVKNIPNVKDRFSQIAMMTGANTPEAMERLKESMKAAGLLKAEDLEKIAPKDIKDSHILLFPVSIRGKRSDPGHAEYHVTLKWFGNDAKPDHEHIQNIVNRYQLHPPELKEFKPDIWETKSGVHHVLKLPSVKKEMEYAHHDLSEETPSQFKYTPHITISPELHKEAASGKLKPSDIKIHPLEYRIGDKHHKTFVPAPQATAHVPAIKRMAKVEIMNEKFKKAVEWLKSTGKPEVAAKLEKAVNELEKGVDEFGNPIKGRNKRYQQAKVFGKPSDTTVHIDGKKTKTNNPQAAASAARAEGKKAVLSSKIPDANGERTSPQRMKMMNTIKDYAEKKTGHKMVVAEGKRDETGKLKSKVGIDKQPFDVFSSKGHKEEKARSAKIKSKNDSLKPGQKPMKRVDPKPDHRSGNLETQPSPDAAVHEIAHEALAPKGMSMAQHQTHMDEKWGESQSKYGHMQQKKTAGEIQPMAAENPLRREMGLPANRTTQKVKDAKAPVEQTVDGTGPRFNRGKDKKGQPVDLMRQSRLLHPENKERINQLRDGRLKYSKDGITEGTSVDAKINARAAQAKAPPQATTPVQAKPKATPSSKKPEKLAANELKGRSFNDLKKEDSKNQFAKESLSSGLSYNDIRRKK